MAMAMKARVMSNALLRLLPFMAIIIISALFFFIHASAAAAAAGELPNRERNLANLVPLMCYRKEARSTKEMVLDDC
jgi:amino acid transporter